MRRTAFQWSKELPTPLRAVFLRAYKAHSVYSAKTLFPSLTLAISSIQWSKTDEGTRFWHQVFEAASDRATGRVNQRPYPEVSPLRPATEWAKYLPNHLRRTFIEAWKNCPREQLHYSLSNAIAALPWFDMPQGFEFWGQMCEAAEARENGDKTVKYPPLPSS